MTRAELMRQRERLLEKVQRGGAGVVEARRRLRKVTSDLMRLELGA
jgi:hypothetical protein